jgi:hypothetical protein
MKREMPPTVICPINLKSTDRQLRNTDLFATYMVIIIGFISAVTAFTGEVSTLSIARHSWGYRNSVIV